MLSFRSAGNPIPLCRFVSGLPEIFRREALRLVRPDSRGPTNAVFRYPAVGVHAWRYWPDQVLETLPDLSRQPG
ncbi:hypothetical protein OG563_17625 [Nocardia vinacea]|uniref:Uncharacterized protein n=1 Tax=Nocardia vinacea TaxID=96468 RepID=A0ABZ1Z2Q2_9NOCA|nr:hypothetical protein [Nocardia vinacea]